MSALVAGDDQVGLALLFVFRKSNPSAESLLNGRIPCVCDSGLSTEAGPWHLDADLLANLKPEKFRLVGGGRAGARRTGGVWFDDLQPVNATHLHSNPRYRGGLYRHVAFDGIF